MTPTIASQRPSRHPTAWLLIGAVGFAALYPWVVLRGMSLDGVIYATVARNMAEGIGDFWHPIYQETEGTFYEHPPLGYALQSLAFRALGDHWWVDRLYSNLMALPMAAVIVLLWRELTRAAPELRAHGWLPVTLWVFMPTWPWIYRNNLLENALGVFSALSVWASLRAMRTDSRWLAWTSLAAAAAIAACLCKSPVGLFPAVTPAVAWLTMHRATRWRAAKIQTALLVTLAAGWSLLLTHPAAREFLSVWFDKQLVRSVLGAREITDPVLRRLSLPWVLAQDLMPSAAAAAICVAAARWRGAGSDERRLAPAAWFALLTAMSASLPIMISPKQAGHYTAPSWPFYMLSLGLWCAPSVAALAARPAITARLARLEPWLRGGAAAAVAALVAISPLWAGKVYRDQQLIADVDKVAPRIARYGVVNMPADMHNAWSLHAYLNRIDHISTRVGDIDDATTYRLDRAQRDGPPEGFEVVDLDLGLLRLYQRVPATATPSAAAALR